MVSQMYKPGQSYKNAYYCTTYQNCSAVETGNNKKYFSNIYYSSKRLCTSWFLAAIREALLSQSKSTSSETLLFQQWGTAETKVRI